MLELVSLMVLALTKLAAIERWELLGLYLSKRKPESPTMRLRLLKLRVFQVSYGKGGVRLPLLRLVMAKRPLFTKLVASIWGGSVGGEEIAQVGGCIAVVDGV